MTRVPIRKEVKERCITQSRDVNRAARDFLDNVGPDIDLFRVHVEQHDSDVCMKTGNPDRFCASPV
jgi:hypothetical protein